MVLGAALAMSYRLAREHLWLLADGPVLAWGVAGLALLVIALRRAFDSTSRPRALRRAAAIVIMVLAFPALAHLGNVLTERIRFVRERSTYDGIVARARAQRIEAQSGREDGLDYIVDPGPPMRVAFLWPGGIVDNWCGVIHDPSGEVMKVNDLIPGSPEWRQSEFTRLFGGDMVACRSLDAPYYSCCFT
jgi:hypothetical protein